MKKMMGVTLVLLFVVFTSAACGGKQVTVSEGSCAAILGHECSSAEELTFLKVRIADGQAAVPDTVAKQLADHKQLVEAAAKLDLETRKAELQQRLLATAAKGAADDPCHRVTGNPRAHAVCMALQ
jgi:hypothetical protein